MWLFVGSSLHLRFVTRSGRPRIAWQWGDDVIQMRGFKAKYTFSDQFVNLGKLIRGLTICSTMITGTSFEVYWMFAVLPPPWCKRDNSVLIAHYCWWEGDEKLSNYRKQDRTITMFKEQCIPEMPNPLPIISQHKTLYGVVWQIWLSSSIYMG